MNLAKAQRSVAMIAAASALMAAVPASATIVVYTFLDPQDAISLTVTTATVMSTETLPSDYCSVPSLCSSITFTPTATYDEVTLLDGSNFYFAPTAFTTVSANFEVLTPVSANPTAEFSTLIAGSAPEPSTWLMMIAGFGMAGGALRRLRRSSTAPATA